MEKNEAHAFERRNINEKTLLLSLQLPSDSCVKYTHEQSKTKGERVTLLETISSQIRHHNVKANGNGTQSNRHGHFGH